MLNNKEIGEAMTIKLDNEYPDYPEFVEGIRRAPDRGFRLTKAQQPSPIITAIARAMTVRGKTTVFAALP